MILLYALRPLYTFPQVGHGIAFGGRGDLDSVAFFSPELLGPPKPVSSSEAVAWPSRGDGHLIALLRGLDLLWCDPSEGSPASKRTILGTGSGPSEVGPSGSASTCPAGEAKLSADKPRAVCVLTCRVRRPVDLVGVPPGATSTPSAGGSSLLSLLLALW